MSETEPTRGGKCSAIYRDRHVCQRPDGHSGGHNSCGSCEGQEDCGLPNIHCQAPACQVILPTTEEALIATLTAQVAEQAQEIAAKETMIAATDAEAAKALLLLTDAEAKLREQAQEIAKLEREVEAQWDKIGTFGNGCACSVDSPDDVCAHHSPKLARAEAKIAERAQEIERLTLAHVADTQAVSAYQRQIEDAMIVLAPNMPSSGLVDACKQVKQVAISEAENSTMLDRKWQKQAQEIERLRREWEDAVERERRLAPSLADTQVMARDAQAKLRAVEALRDEANAALLTAYRALASIHGDAEDCDDCGTIAEAGEDGCRIHTGTRQARLMWEAVEAIEDTLGPCWCGHTRAEHNDCDERICEAKDCTCRCFKLSKLTAMLTLSSKESAT